MLSLKGTIISISLFPLIVLALIALVQGAMVAAIIPLLIAIYGALVLIKRGDRNVYHSTNIVMTDYQYVNPFKQVAI